MKAYFYPRKYQDYTVTIDEACIPDSSGNEKDGLMEYPEEEYLINLGIQHFKFCRRQWALIHVEQQWEENVHTVDWGADA